MAEVYNRHHYMPEMREAIQTWELHLTSDAPSEAA
jgi:hypothetical protein